MYLWPTSWASGAEARCIASGALTPVAIIDVGTARVVTGALIRHVELRPELRLRADDPGLHVRRQRRDADSLVRIVGEDDRHRDVPRLAWEARRDEGRRGVVVLEREVEEAGDRLRLAQVRLS